MDPHNVLLTIRRNFSKKINIDAILAEMEDKKEATTKSRGWWDIDNCGVRKGFDISELSDAKMPQLVGFGNLDKVKKTNVVSVKGLPTVAPSHVAPGNVRFKYISF